MKKRITALLLSLALVAGLTWAGFTYFGFVSQTIHEESTAHLTEIFHQANQTLYNLVTVNWNQMRMWTPYLEKAESEEEIVAYVNQARAETNFTNFYFIARNGEYLTLAGDKGYLDLRDQLTALILEHQPVVANSVVPDKPEIMVFATPTNHCTYRDFAYDAIAITYNNSDLVDALKISAFDRQASTFAVLPDGRVVVDNSSEDLKNFHNLFALLEESESLTNAEITALRENFLAGNSGSMVFDVNGRSYYLVYESANFQNWTVLGIVPADVVNASINKLQSSTLVLVSGVAGALTIVLVVFLIRRYRRSLIKKDMEILYREELFSVLSNNVDDIFAMLDADNLHVEYISPNIERLVGIQESEARKNIRVVDRLVKDAETVLIMDHLPDLQPGEQAEWDREYVHQETGEVRWFHVTALCREIRDGKKYILVMSDRTKERKINQELADAVNAARSANQAKSTFLSNMSHDIRTPMNAIIGFTTLAVSNIENRDKVKDYLAKILSSSNHLLSLINDVLDMSRIESGKINLEEQEGNLSDIFHDIKTIISGQIHAKQLELYMDIMDVTDEDVFCDKTRLNQVLLNLLSNAIKFTLPGGTVSVRVAQLPNAPEGKGLYEIRVKDTGIGMSPEFAARIFEPFERERTSTVSRIQGTGLGMAISKNIVDMMGGTIGVHTEQDKGTEFVIRLALRLQSERRSVEKIKELEGLKALVVDDDFNTCDSVTKMLVQVGMRSEWTLSGKEAVLRARQSIEINDAFHAYIIDWRLPDMNGIEVTRQIRALGDQTPIIILTAYDWTDIESEARAAGVTAFCSKPMFMSDLRETLLTALGQQEARSGGILPNTQAAEGFRGKRLLLAEDNELNREIALEILSEYGFVIDTAENGAVAVEKVVAARPGYYDLVLMDIQMPVMNGYEATRTIRALEEPELANIPILAMTANAFDEDRRAAAECGMDGFLSKPIDIEEVIQTLQSVLNGKNR
ncbi:MAG: response regulator [Oscillospiraceae bacterium]